MVTSAMNMELFRTRGRAARPVSAARGRDLDEADLLLLGEEKGSRPAPLRRISERHHSLARGLAGGMDHATAGAMFNYSESRISILLGDPAFQELLAFYRSEVDGVFRDTHEMLAGLTRDAAEELSLRLEEDPEKFTNGQLMEVVKLAADRSGHGPQSTSTNLNVNVDLAAKLEAARKRVADRRSSVIEGEVR